ncbi:MAG: GNAT family N-acetyltransferase [Chloroflexi bacterium HGW-Chloroflexi-6]|nr:MAG: GNAT family N-acetyltransferase [Chloroflexi bacterium HGW-Chloroflexi-6]
MTANLSNLSPELEITLRPVTPDDELFTCQVYASTRADEMKLVSWTDEQKDAFLKMQFDSQTKHYALHYPNAEYKIIERDGIPIGRLMTENRGDHFLLMDIALLPAHRNAGIGTFLMEELKKEAVRLNLPLVLRVESFNPAQRLYTRLGFVKSREIQIYHEMVWTPETQFCE